MTARRLSSGMLIVMRDGNRIESGNHETLMAKGGADAAAGGYFS